MLVSFNGLMEEVATFTCPKDMSAGKIVKLVGSGSVGECLEGDKFHGVCLVSDGGCASVQLAGYVKLPYTGTAPTIGDAAVVCNADGNGVKFVTNGGRAVTVLDLDTTAKQVGFIM